MRLAQLSEIELSLFLWILEIKILNLLLKSCHIRNHQKQIQLCTNFWANISDYTPIYREMAIMH